MTTKKDKWEDWDFDLLLNYMNKYVAPNTTEWRDDTKFTFLWSGQVILVHYDRDRHRYTILSNLEPEVEKTIYQWLYDGKIKPPERDESEIND